jgi:hypothetical protein
VKKREVQSILAGTSTNGKVDVCYKRTEIACDVEVDEAGNTFVQLLPEEEKTNAKDFSLRTEMAEVVTTDSATAPNPTLMTRPRPAIRAESTMATATLV